MVLTLNCFGGDKRDRTADLLNAIQALSQLSYTPVSRKNNSRKPFLCQHKIFRLLNFCLPAAFGQDMCGIK